jgi:hypothetical protein
MPATPNKMVNVRAAMLIREDIDAKALALSEAFLLHLDNTRARLLALQLIVEAVSWATRDLPASSMAKKRGADADMLG